MYIWRPQPTLRALFGLVRAKGNSIMSIRGRGVLRTMEWCKLMGLNAQEDVDDMEVSIAGRQFLPKACTYTKLRIRSASPTSTRSSERRRNCTKTRIGYPPGFVATMLSTIIRAGTCAVGFTMPGCKTAQQPQGGGLPSQAEAERMGTPVLVFVVLTLKLKNHDPFVVR